MKRILYLVTDDWSFWSHRLALADAAKKHGYEVFVVTQKGEFADRIESRGFKLYPFSICRSFGSVLQELKGMINLARLYKKIKPDLVNNIALKPIIFGSVSARISSVPYVINTYTGLGNIFISRSLMSNFFMLIVVPFMSLILKGKRFYSVVQNADDMKELIKCGLINSKSVSLIRGSGVDTSVFKFTQEAETNSPVVIFASRFLRDKGIIEFVEAVKLLKQTGSVARFVLVGNLDKANPTSINDTELNDWIEQDLVEWWGYRDDMSEVFKQAHIVCLPSYREGLPKVLLEAASSGRPIITTDVPGCREVVIDGINGYLVPVKDPVKLADAINLLLESPDLRRQMGAAGRRRVEENFDINRINSATVDLYEKLLTSASIL